jgi:hypothetical protein
MRDDVIDIDDGVVLDAVTASDDTSFLSDALARYKEERTPLTDCTPKSKNLQRNLT